MKHRSQSNSTNQGPPLSIQQQTSFNGRREASEKAKQALLAKFKARPGPDDPERLKREAARRAIVEARDAREAARAAERAAKAAEEAAERAAQEEIERALEAERRAKMEAERPKAMLREAVLYATQRAQRGSRR